MDWKKAKKWGKAGLRVINDVIPKLPTKEDTTFNKVVKLMSMVDSFRLINGKGNLVLNFFEMLNVEEIHNGQFVDLFFNTPVKETFEMELVELDEYRSIRIAHKPGYGTLYFTEFRWGSKPEVSDDFRVTPDFPFNRVLEVLWEVYEGQIHIEVKLEQHKSRPTTVFSPMTAITDPITGRGLERLEWLKARYQRFKDKSEQCTYLFIGKQGAGKTTLAQRLADAFGGRCMRIDANGLTEVGVQDLDFLLRQLNPSFLIIDDIDKCQNMAQALPKMLSLLAELRNKHPQLTAVLTAATTTGLDPALVRPRRIDKIIEFEDPDEDERRDILFEYGVTGPTLKRLVEKTEGLTPAYLQGIAAQVRCGDSIQEVLADVELMKKLAVQAPAAGVSMEPKEMMTKAAN